MMKSNNSKKEKSMDFEMEHLREHLNSSLDFNNITMSEDLIEKTLNAINAGETPRIAASDANSRNKTNNNTTEDVKKKNKFPIYKFAGVAAAVVILVIGINKVQDNLFMGKKDSSTANSVADLASEKSIADETTVEDNDANAASIAETEGSTATQASEAIENKETGVDISESSKMNESRVTMEESEEAAKKSKVAKDAVNEKTENEDTYATTSETQVTADNSDSDEVIDNSINYSINSSISQKSSDNKSFAKQDDSTNYPIKVTDYIILDDIYQITFYDRNTKDNIEGTNEKKITIDSDVIKEFYQLLNECNFTESDTIPGELYYDIEILLKNKEQSYTLNIKDGIQLTYQDKSHPENDYQLNLEGSTEKIQNWIHMIVLQYN